jgi:hypothetical protein
MVRAKSQPNPVASGEHTRTSALRRSPSGVTETKPFASSMESPTPAVAALGWFTAQTQQRRQRNEWVTRSGAIHRPTCSDLTAILALLALPSGSSIRGDITSLIIVQARRGNRVLLRKEPEQVVEAVADSATVCSRMQLAETK